VATPMLTCLIPDILAAACLQSNPVTLALQTNWCGAAAGCRSVLQRDAHHVPQDRPQ
jgi:hypothetical protein